LGQAPPKALGSDLARFGSSRKLNELRHLSHAIRPQLPLGDDRSCDSIASLRFLNAMVSYTSEFAFRLPERPALRPNIQQRSGLPSAIFCSLHNSGAAGGDRTHDPWLPTASRLKIRL